MKRLLNKDEKINPAKKDAFKMCLPNKTVKMMKRFVIMMLNNQLLMHVITANKL